MPVLRGLASQMADIGSARAEQGGKTISCRKGCGACCRQPVPISESEALALARLVSELPEPRQSEVRARFSAALERVVSSALFGKLRQPAEMSDADLALLSRSYFQLGVACPFLDDESCSIHAERPLACREFLVTSAPEHCAAPSDETVERVPLPAQTFRAVRAVDARATSSAGWTTLIFALEHAATAADPPERPSLEWLREVFAELAGTQGRFVD